MKDAVKLVVGNFYHIDKGFFHSGGKVKLIDFGKLYCIVEDSDTGERWETMCYRLSEWIELQKPTI